MTGPVLLVLAAALLHAAWNVMVKGSEDRFIALWALFGFGAVVSVPFLLVLGLPGRSAWPYLLASSVVHLGYAGTLAVAYDRGDLSVAYPVARGLAPLLTAAGGALLLADRLDVRGYTGVVLVSAALLWIAVRGRRTIGTLWAAATGILIAVYTLLDTAEYVPIESVRYVTALYVLATATLSVGVVITRGIGPLRGVIQRGWRTYLLGGVFSVAAYGLVLAAARTAPVGLVASLRETSVVFGALAGWLIFHEDLGPQRAAAASVAVIGVALLVTA